MTATEPPQPGQPVLEEESTEGERVGWVRRVMGWVGNAVLFLAITGLIFALVEGGASSVISVKRILENQDDVTVSEELHTRFDAELGWVSIPDVDFPDMYGEGKALSTNNRGCRGDLDVQPRTPRGKRRVLCSGDSFTLGFGVSDGDAWCAQLERIDPFLQSVNMGQGGYGVDQAFLWYQRDGADLERAVHIFAFIGDDFLRMQRDHFLGYAKPVLALDGDQLEVRNTPVPRRSVLVRWLAANGRLLREFRTVQLLGAVQRRLFEGVQIGGEGALDETWRVAEAVFDSLAHENTAQGSELVLVFLPSRWDYDRDLYQGWRRRLAEYSDRTGVRLLDMVEDLRALDEEDAVAMYIPYGEPGAPHFNERGNLWVARRLMESGLISVPEPQ